MRQKRKAAAKSGLRPLDDRQLAMAHAVDAIDQALSKTGLTWSSLAEIVAYFGPPTGSANVSSSSKRHYRNLAGRKPCSCSFHGRTGL
jgi:hypothetical protein